VCVECFWSESRVDPEQVQSRSCVPLHGSQNGPGPPYPRHISATTNSTVFGGLGTQVNVPVKEALWANGGWGGGLEKGLE